jgi:prevent-host-death family protein
MNWSVADAKQQLSELLRQARSEPQRVYRRRELVAVVVDPATFDRLQRQAEPPAVTLEQAAARVREVLAEEGYELELPARRDRDSGFGQDL